MFDKTPITQILYTKITNMIMNDHDLGYQ